MPRSVHPVFDYFNYSEETNESKCLIDGCKFPLMTGNRVSNLVKHFQRRHEVLGHEFGEKLKIYSAKNPKQPKNKATVISVKINREDFLLGCLESVVINCRPFTLLKDSGMQRIFRPIIDEFSRVKAATPTDPDYIQHQAIRAAEVIKDKIKAELKGKMVSLQFDLATRMNRCILGVNIQLYQKDKLTVRTLAMRHVLESTESLNLAFEIEKILHEFDLNVDDIYTITTDNGPNVLCCTKVLRIMQERQMEKFISTQNIATVNVEALIELVDIETNRIAQNQSLHFIHQVHCSAHTANLVIGDALDTGKVKVQVETCRGIVKHLRRPTIANLMVAKGLKMAILDCDTRWSSVHGMVSIQYIRNFKWSWFTDFISRIFNFLQLDRLLELKPFCVDLAVANKDFHMDENIWNDLPAIVEVLKIFANKMDYMQKENITMSDTYGVWLELEIRLKKMINCSFAAVILDKLLHRRTQMNIVENDVMLSAIFLDLRFHRHLSIEQKDKASKHLHYLSQKMGIKGNKQINVPPSTPHTVSTIDDSMLENILQEIESTQGTSCATVPVNNTLNEEIKAFCEIERANATVDVIAGWNALRFKFLIFLKFPWREIFPLWSSS